LVDSESVLVAVTASDFAAAIERFTDPIMRTTIAKQAHAVASSFTHTDDKYVTQWVESLTVT
jgi:hypothetical protein